MAARKGENAEPRGVPLNDLLQILGTTSIKVRRDGDAIVAEHEAYSTRVEVHAPENGESPECRVQAVVLVKTPVPPTMKNVLELEEVYELANRHAALGALTTDVGETYIGSRLTIHKTPNVWAELHLPLLFFTAIGATQAVLGALRRSINAEGDCGGESNWTEADMEMVLRRLEPLCVCTSDGLELTAEFALGDGSGSAITGDSETALFQLMADQPHPELGGGLFCLLELPQQFPDEEKLQSICARLNTLEMAAQDLPPHFGAWCPGKLGTNPAYVSFFPNALHAVNGLAVNASFWALNRAQWAQAQLASLGVACTGATP